MPDSQTWTEILLKAILPVATGSVITLFGVWLQSRSEAKRLRLQLEHDAKQREKERQMDLRREVFLGAAEALGKQVEYINLFSKTDFDYWKDQEILRGSPGAANKVHLIASNETIEAYAQAYQVVLEATPTLTKMRFEIEEVKTAIKGEGDLIAFLLAQRDETLLSIKALAPSAGQAQAVYETLNRQFTGLQERIDKAYKKQVELQSYLAQLLMKISGECFAVQNAFGKKLIELNLAARREVDLPIDEGRYREFTERTSKKAEAIIGGFIEDMNVWIAEQKRKLDSQS